jgi:tetratricopeptide (TPR) repeat protein
MKMAGWSRLSAGFVKKDAEKFDEAVAEFSAAKKTAEDNKLTDLGEWADISKVDILEEYGKVKEAAAVLSKVPKTRSIEFELRRRLLELKLGILPESEKPSLFNGLIEECKAFPELKWEALAAYAAFLEGKGRFDEANGYFRQAYEVITSIAENLGEAYKDSYKAQRYRLKVVQRFEPRFNVKPARPAGPSKRAMEEKTSEIK